MKKVLFIDRDGTIVIEPTDFQLDSLDKLVFFPGVFQNLARIAQELDYKLELKSFSIAKQYDQISDFEASIKSFDNFIFEFPGSKLRENALFYRLDSAYKLAVNSVEYKNTPQNGLVHLKKERLETAKEYSEAFKEIYANSEYIENVNEMASAINEVLKSYSTKS